MNNPLTPVIAIFYLLLLGIAFVWSRFLDDFQFHFFRGDDPGRWMLQAGIGLLAGLIITVVSTTATSFFRWARDLEREFRDILGPFGAGDVIFLALASGIVEEILFRGVVQEALGLVAASVIFGLLHVGPSARYLPWTIYATAAGFLFGFLYERGGLVPVMLAHFLVNLISLTRINRRRQNELFLRR